MSAGARILTPDSSNSLWKFSTKIVPKAFGLKAVHRWTRGRNFRITGKKTLSRMF